MDDEHADDVDALNDHALNDHAADDSAEVVCPYCGEVQEIVLDPGGGQSQAYVEDCQVCCRPWQVHVAYDENGFAAVSVDPEDDEDGADY